MKTTHYFLSTLIVALLFSSCGSISISQKRYSRGLNIDWFAKKDDAKTTPAQKTERKKVAAAVASEGIAVVSEDLQPTANTEIKDAAVEQSALISQPVTAKTATRKQAVRLPLRLGNIARKATAVKAVKSEFLKTASINKPSTASAETNEISTVILVILCIIPPLGILAVALHEGELNVKFLISILLHLLFILPGIIYSLLVVLDAI